MRIDTDTAANLAASNVVHGEWIGHHDQLPDRVAGVRVVQSWDVGTTINKGSSFSVCTTWAVDKKAHWGIATLTCPDHADRNPVDRSRGCGRLVPFIEGFVAKLSECAAGDQMALDVEQIVDGGVKGEEPLRRAG